MADKTGPVTRASTMISIRVPQDLLAVLDQAADDAYRSRTSQVLHYIDRGLREDLYLGDPTEDGEGGDDG